MCVNLYPFELAVDRPELDEADLIEMIDVGGPGDAARGGEELRVGDGRLHGRRTTSEVLEELRSGSGATTLELRRRLAAIAFARTAAYEAAIARWFQRRRRASRDARARFDKALDLSYGENPHQTAAYYTERGARTHLLAFVEQLQGKPLSFNNLNDLSAARAPRCASSTGRRASS